MRKKYMRPSVFAAFVGLLLAACGSGTAQNNTKMEENPKLVADSAKPDSIKIDTATLTKDFLMGKFDPAKDERYTLVKPPLSTKNLYAHKETLAAFEEMRVAAQKEGISLAITSCVRNFDMQKGIWEAKWNSQKPVDGKILPPLSQLKGKARAEKILLWNSMPGTSRHHWGTDIDINSVSPAYFESGKGKKEYEWLQANAVTYGFCQTYSPIGAERPTGYQEEKWHWSYLPLAKIFTETYGRTIKNEDIKGFVGCESAIEIDVVKNYVLGINPKCK